METEEIEQPRPWRGVVIVAGIVLAIIIALLVFYSLSKEDVTRNLCDYYNETTFLYQDACHVCREIKPIVSKIEGIKLLNLVNINNSNMFPDYIPTLVVIEENCTILVGKDEIKNYLLMLK